VCEHMVGRGQWQGALSSRPLFHLLIMGGICGLWAVVECRAKVRQLCDSSILLLNSSIVAAVRGTVWRVPCRRAAVATVPPKDVVRIPATAKAVVGVTTAEVARL
jgi:hypothetical protein